MTGLGLAAALVLLAGLVAVLIVNAATASRRPHRISRPAGRHRSR